ncbi:hypothetical protein EV360DRAFT_74363 [Lentinula raphanica]|nr:hypothetical protein EV360DRAFT_74363 [Lentinula raphanica]
MARSSGLNGDTKADETLSQTDRGASENNSIPAMTTTDLRRQLSLDRSIVHLLHTGSLSDFQEITGYIRLEQSIKLQIHSHPRVAYIEGHPGMAVSPVESAGQFQLTALRCHEITTTSTLTTTLNDVLHEQFLRLLNHYSLFIALHRSRWFSNMRTVIVPLFPLGLFSSALAKPIPAQVALTDVGERGGGLPSLTTSSTTSLLTDEANHTQFNGRGLPQDP